MYRSSHRLSAWGARDLSSSNYKGSLWVDFVPDLGVEDVKSLFSEHKLLVAVTLLCNLNSNGWFSIAPYSAICSVSHMVDLYQPFLFTMMHLAQRYK